MDAAALEALTERLKASPALAAKADIGIVAARLGLAQGAIPVGDDCAAIPDGDGRLLFAAEGFISAFVDADPWFAGWCGVMVNLSDVAAMGGRPLAIVDVIWAEGEDGAKAVLDGLRAAAAAYGVPIVGGHTNLRNRETHLAVAVLGRAGARLLTSFDAKPGDVLVMVVDRRGAYREPFDNFQAALEAPPERLRADLALLPELAEKRSRARRQGHQPGRRSRHGGDAGRKLRRVDRARSRRHRAAAGRGARALAQDVPELRLSSVRRSRKCRARAFVVSRARAACGFDRRRQTGKPGHPAFRGPKRPSSRLWRRTPDGVRRGSASRVSRPLRVAMLTHSTLPRGGVVHAMSLAEALEDLGVETVLHAPDAAGCGFFRKPRCAAIAFPVEPAPRDTADMVEQRIDDYLRWFRRPENRGFDLYHAHDGIGANALATLKAGGLDPRLRSHGASRRRFRRPASRPAADAIDPRGGRADGRERPLA